MSNVFDLTERILLAMIGVHVTTAVLVVSWLISQ